MTGARRLVTMRHAQAESFAATDRARRLSDRGLRDAVAAGLFLRERGVEPDVAVVSPATRARQTWEAVAEPLQARAEVRFDGAVYDGSADMLLETLQLTPAQAGTVLLVGHQPTVGQLAHLLEDGTGDPDALHLMLHGFPAASLAVFEISVDWCELEPETGRLLTFRPGGV